MKLLIKEIDTLRSKKHKGRSISEYIIYVMYEDTPTQAFTVFGREAVNDKIISLFEKLGSLNIENFNNN